MYFRSDAQLLLEALLVLRASPYHQKWSINKMQKYIIAAIQNNKLLIVYDREQRPVGLFTWAYLPSDREKSYMNNPSSLVAGDFASDRGTLWAIDFAAPYGFCRDVVRALRHEFPKGTRFRIYRTEQNRFGWMIA
jgi:hemolysin-activating ACP:hemolysin acyltransferase